MRKWIAGLLVMFMLTGCTAEEKATHDQLKVQTEQAQSVEQQSEAAPENIQSDEMEVEHIPMEIVIAEPETEESIESAEPMLPPEIQWEDQEISGLIEDTVGYIAVYPVFSGVGGAKVINRFYADIASQIENIAKTTVHPRSMEQFTVADVIGSYEILGVSDGILSVTYTTVVEYGNSDPEITMQTDYFDLSTGQRQ